MPVTIDKYSNGHYNRPIQDEGAPGSQPKQPGFQSARPVRGATWGEFPMHEQCGISIRAPRAGRDACPPRRLWPDYSISIRAPRAGRDDGAKLWFSCNPDFNPRAPCGARLDHQIGDVPAVEFQSARPVRGATLFSARYTTGSFISIRAPRAGRDAFGSLDCIGGTFQSARPVRGATSPPVTSPPPASNFNPRAPCGARLKGFCLNQVQAEFQSARPVRGAT